LESNKRHRQKEGYQSPSRSHQRPSRIGDVGESGRRVNDAVKD
jgi:hypothetical protein